MKYLVMVLCFIFLFINFEILGQEPAPYDPTANIENTSDSGNINLREVKNVNFQKKNFGELLAEQDFATSFIDLLSVDNQSNL